MTVIATGLDGSKPMSVAQGRYGELIITQGNGLRPKRWAGTGAATHAGITAPAAAPTCTLITPARYYVARCDVHKPGACYNAPPAVTFTTSGAQPAGHQPAEAASYLSQAHVSELVMKSGGRRYSEPPAITLSDSHGKDAVIEAVLDGTPPDPGSITQCEVVSDGPPWPDELEAGPGWKTSYPTLGSLELPISGNGSFSVTGNWTVTSTGCDPESTIPVTLTLTYTVSGIVAGPTGTQSCVLRVGFYGQFRRTVSTDPCFTLWYASWGVSGVTIVSSANGFAPASSFEVRIQPIDSGKSPAKDIVLECRTPENSRNTATPRFSVKELTITSGGSGFTVAPELKFLSSSGFGAQATCTIANGSIDTVTLEQGGGGYKVAPVVEVVSGGAECFAVARPHMRGKYQCYYRYVDNTPESAGGPIASNLSPVREVDAGDGAQGITWSTTGPVDAGGRTLSVELWRTTGNQATTLYRVATASGSYTDDLTDAELRDPDRAGYAAMPIVLPNGELNANRFGVPPSDKAVVVRFQDRFWYGVDTSGDEPNTLYFSEIDEPESVPDVNEFVLQQNSRDGDAITALVPYGRALLIMQSRRTYSLTYARKPLLDGDVAPIAHRGCLNQRCWDIHGGLCYAMDQHGIYSISPQGQIEDLSAPIADLFRTEVDYSEATFYFVTVDPRTSTLRAFLALHRDASGGKPVRALCYSIETQTWWVERYPQPIASGAAAPLNSGDYRALYAAPGGVCLLDEGAVDLGRGSILTVTVTNKGRGYRTPPTITANGGSGAELSACINAAGELSGVWIVNPGYEYTSGSLVISAPNDPDCGDPVQATATFTASAFGGNSPMRIPYRLRTGNVAFPNDSTARGGGQLAARDISLTYRPQPAACEVALRLYYNNSTHARFNVASRNRGVGFTHGTSDSAARLDMGALSVRTGHDTGVAKGVFAGRTIDDIQSSDRHVAVELIGSRRTADPVVFYELDVYGTAAGE